MNKDKVAKVCVTFSIFISSILCGASDTGSTITQIVACVLGIVISTLLCWCWFPEFLEEMFSEEAEETEETEE